MHALMTGKPGIYALVEQGDIASIRAFLDENPEALHEPFSEEFPDQPLHRAVVRGDANIVALLLERGADVRAKGTIYSEPLHHAALYGRVEIAQLLIEAGADVNLMNSFKKTPLEYAVDGREPSRLAVAELLRENGVLPDAWSLASLGDIDEVEKYLYLESELRPKIDLDGLIHEAFMNMFIQVMSESSESETQIIGKYELLIDCLLEAGGNINSVDAVGEPPLFTAIESDSAALVRFAIKKGADVNFRAHKGEEWIDAWKLAKQSENPEIREMFKPVSVKRGNILESLRGKLTGNKWP